MALQVIALGRSATKPSLPRRVYARIKGFFISQPYPKLELKALTGPFSSTELTQLNNYLDVETGDGRFFTRQGALLSLNAKKKIVVIGDLHGNLNRLDRIVENFGPRLISGEIVLTFLGDAIHPEERQNLSDMESSIQTLNAIIRLKQKYPDQVHYLQGNQDKNAMGLIKSGVLQAFVFLGELIDYYTKCHKYTSDETKQMIAGYQKFFDACPLSAIVEGKKGAAFMAHSAVVKGGGLTRQKLIDARKDPDLVTQLQWNTPKSRGPSMDRFVYSEGDVRATIQGLQLNAAPANTYVISGHTPHNQDCIYRPFPKVNHFIVHGNVSNSFGVIIIDEGMPKGMNIPVDPRIALAV